MTAFWHTFTSAASLLTHIRLGFASAALAMYLASVVVVAIRWRLILRALGVVTTTWNVLLTYSAGVFTGNVTPARTLGNDAVRIALIRMRTDASVKVATASVVYDRASEGPAICVIVLIALPTLHPPIAAVLGIAAALAVGALVPAVRRGITARVSKWHDTIVGVPVSGQSVAGALGWSMFVWLQDSTRIWFGAAALGVYLSPSQAATLTSIRLVSNLVPIPGGIGVVEGSAIAGLVWFGVPVETATAITILERAILYGCGTLIGGVSLMLLGGRRVLKRVLEKRAQTAAAIAVLVLMSAARPARAQVTATGEYRVAVSRYESMLRAEPGDLETGAAYRQLTLGHDECDRAIDFFKSLAKGHRGLANIELSLAFAYVDKIPTVGRIHQGLLGRDAINAFGRAIEIEPSWIAYYTRGFIDLFYDGILKRARPAVDDFGHALVMQHAGPKRPYYVRTFKSLGDAYWKLGELDHARAAWTDGLKEFPGDAELIARLAAEGRALYSVIESGLDSNVRQDTTLKGLVLSHP